MLVETSAKKVTSVYKTTATERFVADKLVRTVTVVHPTTVRPFSFLDPARSRD